MKRVALLVCSLGLMVMQPALAQEGEQEGGFEQKNLYLGIGFGSNWYEKDGVEYDTAGSSQIFLGYRFPQLLAENIDVMAELGYHSTQNFKKTEYVPGLPGNPPSATITVDGISGTYLAGVIDWHFHERFSGLARLGWDFGDTDGVYGGLGVGFIINENWRTSLEYQIREDLDTAILNVTYSF